MEFAKTLAETQSIARQKEPSGLVELVLTPSSFAFRYVDTVVLPFGLQATFDAFTLAIENHIEHADDSARQVSVRVW